MRTGFIVITMTLALAFAGFALAPGAHAACEACDGPASGKHPRSIEKRATHRSYRTEPYPALPIYGAGLPGCYWRKMRLWDPDGQYFLVSRIQFCR
jgi:hypothetical protein